MVKFPLFWKLVVVRGISTTFTKIGNFYLVNNAAIEGGVSSCKVLQVLQHINKFISRGLIALIAKLPHVSTQLETLLNFYWLEIWGSLRILFSFSEISFLVISYEIHPLLLRLSLHEVLLLPLYLHLVVLHPHLLLLDLHGGLLLVHTPHLLLFLSPALWSAALAHPALWP